MTSDRTGATVERAASDKRSTSSTDVARQFDGRLESGERLLWTGHPPRGLMFHAYDFLLIPFSLVWSAGAIAGGVAAMLQASGPGPLFGLPFVAVALYLLVGRFIIDAVGRGRTYYAVTDRRAIILSGIISRDTRSIFLRALAEVNPPTVAPS